MSGVLILDDREDNLLSMQAILAREPYPVAIESDPNNLFSQITAHEPEVLVLDLRLPGGTSGIDLARLIRQTIPSTVMRILAVTAAPEMYTDRMAIEAGCDSYFSKPFGIRDFRDEVNRLLDL
ncbi:MAG: response regulator [Chloroflexota bacterium]